MPCEEAAIRFRIRWGDREVEYEGSDARQEYEKILKHVLQSASAESARATGELRAEGQTLPTIQGASSVSEAIMRVLGTDWGRAQPRTAKELNEALQVSAVYVEAGTLTGMLTYLVKKGRLRRVKLPEGVFGYMLPLGTEASGG